MKTLKFISWLLFFVVAIIIVYWIDWGIRSHDLWIYSGKDGGYSLRIESIIILSTCFCFLQALETQNLVKSLVYGLLGAIVALLVSLICYFWLPTDDYGTVFHVVSFFVSLVLGFLINLYLRKS